MASARDSSPGTDQEYISPARRSSAVKILTSSSDEEINNSQQNDASKRRCSSRKRRKRFQMPSREDQWNAISTTSSVSNCLSHLQPRKLINDFTKITHRYNYDHVEISGEESMEEFIKDTDSPDSPDSSNSDSTSETNTKKHHRVKGYRPRIASMPESSEESEEEPSKPESGEKPNTGNSFPKDWEHTTGQRMAKQQLSVKNSSEKPKTLMTNTSHHVQNKGMPCTEEGNSLSSGEDIQVANTARKSRKKSGLDSDSDDLKNSSSEHSPQVPSVRKSRKQLVLNSDSESQSATSAAECDLQEVKPSKKSKAKSALDSDSDAGGQEPLPEDVACPKQGKNDQRATRSSEKSASSSKNCNAPSGVISAGTSCSAGQGPDTDSAENSSDSGDAENSDEGSSAESSDSMQGKGRIQKLAAQKRKKRESIFGQLKSARAKRQKKS